MEGSYLYQPLRLGLQPQNISASFLEWLLRDTSRLRDMAMIFTCKDTKWVHIAYIPIPSQADFLDRSRRFLWVPKLGLLRGAAVTASIARAAGSNLEINQATFSATLGSLGGYARSSNKGTQQNKKGGWTPGHQEPWLNNGNPLPSQG